MCGPGHLFGQNIRDLYTPNADRPIPAHPHLMVAAVLHPPVRRPHPTRSTYHSTTLVPAAAILVYAHARMPHSLPLAQTPHLLPSTHALRDPHYQLQNLARGPRPAVRLMAPHPCCQTVCYTFWTCTYTHPQHVIAISEVYMWMQLLAMPV
jgi:hypothetical protein